VKLLREKKVGFEAWSTQSESTTQLKSKTQWKSTTPSKIHRRLTIFVCEHMSLWIYIYFGIFLTGVLFWTQVCTFEPMVCFLPMKMILKQMILKRSVLRWLNHWDSLDIVYRIVIYHKSVHDPFSVLGWKTNSNICFCVLSLTCRQKTKKTNDWSNPGFHSILFSTLAKFKYASDEVYRCDCISLDIWNNFYLLVLV